MRLDGRWYVCHDGVVRPLVLAEVVPAVGDALDVVLLVDTGADRTRLSSHFRAALAVADGNTEADVAVRFHASITIPGPVQLESDPRPREYSILGRDVLNQFTVVLDRSRNLVALLTPDHGYAIDKS